MSSSTPARAYSDSGLTIVVVIGPCRIAVKMVKFRGLMVKGEEIITNVEVERWKGSFSFRFMILGDEFKVSEIFFINI